MTVRGLSGDPLNSQFRDSHYEPVPAIEESRYGKHSDRTLDSEDDEHRGHDAQDHHSRHRDSKRLSERDSAAHDSQATEDERPQPLRAEVL